MFQPFFQFTDRYLRFSSKEKSAIEEILIYREISKKYPLLKKRDYKMNKELKRLVEA